MKLKRYLKFGDRSASALIDQVLISGSNFLTTIVLVRGLGLTGFGQFSIVYVLLLYANALQASFIANPMLSIAPGLKSDDARSFVDGMFALQIGSSGALSVAFLVLGCISRAFSSYFSWPCIAAFACCVGTFQLQDWVRRCFFLYNHGVLAICSDVVSYFLQLVALTVLWRLGQLTLFRVLIVITLTSIGGFALGPLCMRFRPSVVKMQEAWSRTKKLSSNMVLASQVNWFGYQGILLICAKIVGPTEAGGLRATQSMTGPMNLILTSLENVVPVQVAEALNDKGARRAYRSVMRAIVRITLIFTPFVLVFALFGRPLLVVAYGARMGDFFVPMILQLLAMLVQIAARLLLYFYRGIQDSRAIVRSSLAGAAGCLVTVFLFGSWWGAVGVCLASLAGQMIVVGYCMLHWSMHGKGHEVAYPDVSKALEMPVSSAAKL